MWKWKITERNKWKTTENGLARWVRQCIFCCLAGTHFLVQRLNMGGGAIFKDTSHDLSTDWREVKVWSKILAHCLGKSFVFIVHNPLEIQNILSCKFPVTEILMVLTGFLPKTMQPVKSLVERTKDIFHTKAWICLNSCSHFIEQCFITG